MKKRDDSRAIELETLTKELYNSLRDHISDIALKKGVLRKKGRIVNYISIEKKNADNTDFYLYLFGKRVYLASRPINRPIFAVELDTKVEDDIISRIGRKIFSIEDPMDGFYNPCYYIDHNYLGDIGASISERLDKFGLYRNRRMENYIQ